MRRILFSMIMLITATGCWAQTNNSNNSVVLGNTKYKAYTDSLTQIGDLHFFTTGNFEKAIQSYTKAYKKGGVEAAFMLGRCFFEGLGTEYDWDAAVMLWTQAARAGNVDAMIKLGECYLFATGVEPDLANSFQWYNRAHENGSIEAAYVLGSFYYGGSVVEKDVEKALKYWTEAADAGMKQAQEALGLEYYEGKNTKRNILEGLKYLRMAADQGAPKAAFYTGLCYEKSYGLPGEDYISAAYYYMVAADAEIAAAQVRLANLYYLGLGVEKNPERAAYWLKQAQLNGYVLDSDEEK